jgi:hypothetical protein
MGTKKTKKTGHRSTPSFGVYLDDDIHQRYTLGIMKERVKLVEKGKSPLGVSKSGLVAKYIEDWLNKKGY